MCDPTSLAAVTGLFTGGAGATAAGATAGASTLGSTLQTIGTVASIGGSVVQGIQGYQTAKANAAAIGEQKSAEASMTAREDQRTRAQYRSALRRQTAQLAANGVSLDSPTAVLLGQISATEGSYASQGVRQTGRAKQAELTATQRSLAARGVTSLLSGVTGAAGSFLTAAPKIWPELGN